MLSPRPKVSSSSSVSGRSKGSLGRIGASTEESRTSTRGCSAVPRIRTVIGGSPCSRALVTSSDTPSWAHSASSGLPISVAQVADPAARVLHAAGAPAQGEGRPVERHGGLQLDVMSAVAALNS